MARRLIICQRGKGMAVKYEIDFQFLPKGAAQTEEIGGIADLVMGEEGGNRPDPGGGRLHRYPAQPHGRARELPRQGVPRLFRYVLGYCYVRVIWWRRTPRPGAIAR